MKHRVRINVEGGGRKQSVLEASEVRIPSRILHFLFGDFTTVYLLKPGETVDSVDIMPVPEQKTAAKE